MFATLHSPNLRKSKNLNGQFSDVFTKSEYKQIPPLDRFVPSMHYIVVTKEGVIVLKEPAMELRPVFAHFFQQSFDTG